MEETIEILSKVKKSLKSSPIVLQICKEHGFHIDIIDGIPIEFDDDLEASAKTINSCIKLNRGLVDEGFDKIMRYAIHELTHALQHMKREGVGDPYEGEEYLDRPDELEAFQNQIKFEEAVNGVEEAEKYVDELVEYHDIPKEERSEKKEELMEKVPY